MGCATVAAVVQAPRELQLNLARLIVCGAYINKTHPHRLLLETNKTLSLYYEIELHSVTRFQAQFEMAGKALESTAGSI